MEEIAHLQGALMLRDEIGDRPGKAITTRQLQTFIHVGLEDSCTGEWVVEAIVGVFDLAHLVLDEPLRGVQFADIVLERPCAQEVDVGANGSRALFRQATDHQRVLKRARSFRGEAP